MAAAMKQQGQLDEAIVLKNARQLGAPSKQVIPHVKLPDVTKEPNDEVFIYSVGSWRSPVR
jgi:hypothetical protein